MDEEKVKVTIEIPKNTVAFTLNILIDNHNGNVVINSQSYDSNDVEKLIEDSEKMGE